MGSFLEGEEREILARFLLQEDEKLKRIKPDYASGFRSVKPEKLHITWQFLGELKEAELLKLEESLEALKAPLLEALRCPFSITYDYAEAWPARDDARVIVARPHQEGEKLKTAARILREALAGHSRADRAVERNLVFKPHVTLYRIRQAGDEAIETILSDFSPFEQTIRSIDLIESHLKSEQAGNYSSTYRSLLQIQL